MWCRKRHYFQTIVRLQRGGFGYEIPFLISAQVLDPAEHWNGGDDQKPNQI